jgi:1-deoxy-D-xylulose-5-phosphate reductoisomerase
MPTVLNAANEIAVEAFLNEQLRFTDIAVIIENTMAKFEPKAADTLELVLAADADARVVAKQLITELKV